MSGQIKYEIVNDSGLLITEELPLDTNLVIGPVRITEDGDLMMTLIYPSTLNRGPEPEAVPHNYSIHQMRVIGTEGVTLVGNDQRGRPVVEKDGLWGRRKRWAVGRNGDPVEIYGTVTPRRTQ